MKLLARAGGLLASIVILLNGPGALAGAAAANAVAPGIPEPLKDIGITEHLGSRVGIEKLRFRDETGRDVALSEYFHSGRPVLLSLVYYECPNLCTFVLNGMVSSLKKLPLEPGRQFEIVSVSINPRETPELAARKKAAYLASLGKPEAASAWHFLTGDEAMIRQLAEQVGFKYRYVEEDRQYAHSAALYVLTPEGAISRYLYGIEFAPKDLRLALLEASDGKIGTVVDRILLMCFRYDPKTHKYTVYTNVLRAGAATTILLLGAFIFAALRGERRVPVPGLTGEGV